MNRTLILLFALVVASCQTGARKDDQLLRSLMQSEPAKFRHILDAADSLEVQIIYTQINRDANNRPSFRSFYFNLDSNRYFYPASTVKLPLVLLSLEKLNELKIRDLDKFTPMFSDSVYPGQHRAYRDSTSENKLPSVAHYIKKILLVSDNDASNRLYEFMGQGAANHKLHAKGYNIRLLHRVGRALTIDQNRHTEATRFVKDGTLIYSQPMLVNKDSIRPPAKVFKGIGYINNGMLIRQPFDFTYKNSYPLVEQQRILRSVIFRQSIPEKERFNIAESDRRFVLRYMSQWPRESKYPSYKNDTSVYDAFCKFLMFAEDRRRVPPNIRIFNKIGNAYGYLIDNAYIVDFDNGVEFMLSAVISTNSDGIYNDDKYDYHKIGYPFMRNLGQLVYGFELKRERDVRPDLSEFRLTYE
jgi:hypothetical protein